ncbi:hypothetical protein QFZ70_002456 [Arthrobacter sp. V1I9]|nr:hypothetical protein [Arthrobacter sp. V1I9]
MAPSGPFGSGWCFESRMGAAFSGRRRRLGGQGSSIADCIGQCQEVVRARLLRRGGHGQAENFPATGDGEGISVLLAEIVTMGLRVRGQRTKDRCGIRVDVRKSSYR